MPMKRDALEAAIARLDRLLRSGESSEAKYQEYFEQNLAVFEVLGYVSAHPKPQLPWPDGGFLEPDFLVQRTDGLFEIFELKTPQERLVCPKKYRNKFTAKVNEYLSQAQYYSEYFDDSENRNRVKALHSLDVQKSPDMVLVVGTDDGVDKKLLHLLTRRETNALRIVTYDDILSTLRFHHAAFFGHPETLSGASWHAILTLHKIDVSRRQYIFDVGDSLSRNRWSVYLNERGQLCFEILDQDGVVHTISVSPGNQSFHFDVKTYVCCEFGSSDDFSWMQLLVDNRIVAEREWASPISVSSGLDFGRKIIGADLEAKNHGTFTMAGLAIYQNTLTFQQRYAISEAIFEQFFAPPTPEEMVALTNRLRPVLPNTSAYLIIGELGELK
jgi:hypothetical protein